MRVWDALLGRLKENEKTICLVARNSKTGLKCNVSFLENQTEEKRDLTDPRLQILIFSKKPVRSEESSGRLSGWEIRTTSSQVKVPPVADTERVGDFDFIEVWVVEGEGNDVVKDLEKAWETLEMKSEEASEYGILWEGWRLLQVQAIGGIQKGGKAALQRHGQAPQSLTSTTRHAP
jgi:hypothetical protein